MIGRPARPGLRRPIRAGQAVLGLALAALAAGMMAQPARAAEAVTAGTVGGRTSGSWAPAWSSDFSSGLPSGCGTYSGTYGTSGNAWSPSEVSTSSGLLRITLERRTTAGRAWTSGGVGCWGTPQTYGRFEIIAKVPPGKGIDSYLALWPVQGSQARWSGVELLAPGRQTAYLTNGWGSGTDVASVNGSYTDGFHRYVLDWTPAGVTISKDGSTLLSSRRSYAGPRFLVLVVSNGDALTGVPATSTRLPAQFQVDSVRVWRYTGLAGAGGRDGVGAMAAGAAGSSHAGMAAAGATSAAGAVAPSLAATRADSGVLAGPAAAGSGAASPHLATPTPSVAASAGSAIDGDALSSGVKAALTEPIPAMTLASSSSSAAGGPVVWVVVVLLVGVVAGIARSYSRSPQRQAARGQGGAGGGVGHA